MKDGEVLFAAGSGPGAIVTTDRFIPHLSTVPATAGQTVGLFLRERVLPRTLQPSGRAGKPPVVLMVHGGFAPSIVAYDLQYKDYSFMAALARIGFDVFTLSHTGYAPSPRPLMDDPCNVDTEFQPLLMPHILKELSPPRYPFKLVSSRSEWDELETAVRFILELRGVDRISLVGWSTGAPRAGGYAALHPEKVDKLVMFGPSPYFPNEEPPKSLPEPGAPMILQSKEFLLQRRWRDNVHCEGQLEDAGVCEAMWREIMVLDELGAHWGLHGEGIMRAPNRMNFGWRSSLAKIQAPTLVLLGEFDSYQRRREAWQGLCVDHRLFIKVSCASHFMQFEQGRHLLYRATGSWVTSGSVDGFQRGECSADVDGVLSGSATHAACLAGGAERRNK
jgi:pimeloyl-ACP methyl ester carboxylesterase